MTAILLGLIVGALICAPAAYGLDRQQARLNPTKPVPKSVWDDKHGYVVKP